MNPVPRERTVQKRVLQSGMDDDSRQMAGAMRDSAYSKYFVALFAILLSSFFSFFIYPHMMDSFHAVLDPDDYGTLGYGLWLNGSLSFYPDTLPTVTRGPVYPLFIAALLAMTKGWYPYAIQFAQCVLFGLTTLLTYFMAARIWNKSVALYAQIGCALYPFLIWYTPRIWIEILAAFLFTALIAGTFCLSRSPTMFKAVFVGVLLGVCTLCKQTFLPFILIIPLLLFVFDRKIKKTCLIAVCVTAILVVFPWSLRNWNLAKRPIPVHLLAGQNFQRGDTYCRYYPKAPLSSRALWELGTEEIEALCDDHLTGVEKEVADESALLKKSFETYRHDPVFLLKKIALNSIYFWMLGETREKTIVIASTQLVLVILFVLAVISLIKTRRCAAEMIPVCLVVIYYASHLPIYANARFSVVLIPTLMAYAMGIFDRFRKLPKS